MTDHMVRIGIVDYPEALQSCVYGLKEMFMLANHVCEQHDIEQRLYTKLLKVDEIVRLVGEEKSDTEKPPYSTIIFPPAINAEGFYLSPDQKLQDWILKHHARGTTICSVCAGAYILASTGLLNKRVATTHWSLASHFSQEYPDVLLDIEKILINDGDIITAGGLMSWMDLGLELVAQLTHPNVMRQVGKYLVIDTGRREQRYYQSFSPKWDHGEMRILKAQHYMQAHFNEPITIAELSDLSFLSERTFLRRFIKATGIKPTQYLQKLRIQKACDLMETTTNTFDVISRKVGYEDTSSFRKVFVKIIGLTPRDFRSRFSSG